MPKCTQQLKTAYVVDIQPISWLKINALFVISFFWWKIAHKNNVTESILPDISLTIKLLEMACITITFWLFCWNRVL